MMKNFGIMLMSIRLMLDTTYAAPGASDWPFLITPEASPALHLMIHEFKNQEHVVGISLRHELIFDGIDYQSYLVTLGIESHLISSGRGKFIWSRFDGGEVALSLAPAAPSQAWILKTITPESYEICSADGTERYYFNNSQLAEFNIKDRFYRLDYEQGRVAGVSRYKPGDEQLVTIKYDSRGTISQIDIQGRVFHYHYDKSLKLSSIDGGSRLSAIFGYKNNLLSEVQLGAVHSEFTWGSPRLVDYFTSPLPSPPVVTSDPLFTYETTSGRDHLGVSFFSKHTPCNKGEWRLNKRDGSIQYRSN